MFKLFGFLESSKDRNGGGIGLGLYISQQIVTEFGGGPIDLDSDIGEGSIFTFRFKLEAQPEVSSPLKKVFDEIVRPEKSRPNTNIMRG